jgi:glycosyltransferase involved in cell wall biosynthesis
MPKRVLLVAFHFPPVRGSSGVQRTLAFARYLPEFGWEPAVLTVHPRAYPEVGEDLLRSVPEGLEVARAFALHAPRHLAVAGRYPLLFALPDEWSTWWLGGVASGLRLLRRFRPQVLWSTFPIATAHCIGATLQRRSGLPWVADCRDSMTETDYPPNPWRRRVYRRIERALVERAARVVFTAPGALRMYAERYPAAPSALWSVIANGYDEEAFPQGAPGPAPVAGRPLKLLHSGALYPSERDPRPFYAAVAAMKAAGELDAARARIVLRATGYDAHHRRLIDAAGVGDVVALEGHLPYREALAEMAAADGLLVFQASNCNHQIPAKLYEYLRAGRPILALTDPSGDTAGAVRGAGLDTIAPLHDEGAIRAALRAFLGRLRDGTAPRPDPVAVAGASRRARARELAELLDAVVAAGPRPPPRR